MGQAAELLEVQPAFLRSLDAAGVLTPHRSGGGHRRYSRRQLAVAARMRALFDEGLIWTPPPGSSPCRTSSTPPGRGSPSSSGSSPSARTAPAPPRKIRDGAGRTWAQSRSNTAAMPWPPPTHIVTSA